MLKYMRENSKKKKKKNINERQRGPWRILMERTKSLFQRVSENQADTTKK